MTFATGRLEEATITRAALATTFNQARPLVVPGRLRRATVIIGDLCAAMGIVLCIPFVIVAIGMPVACCACDCCYVMRPGTEPRTRDSYV